MHRLIFLFLIFFLTACASARMSDLAPDVAFHGRRYDEAVQKLTQGLQDQGEDGRDQLLYLLDLGLVLHTQGKYQESNEYFLKADQVAEIKDYTSLSTEGATLLTTDQIRQYKGEDFEKVLINTYLAMNYALLGDYENALVEARRVNRKLDRMVNEGQRKYKQNAFARYLSAILYEVQGHPNDAYIDYQSVHELEPSFPGLGLDLWRTAWMAGLRENLAEIDRKFHLTREDHKKAKRGAPGTQQGEIIVFYENGISPVKVPHPYFPEIPVFSARYNPIFDAQVNLNGHEAGQTSILHSIQRTAIENLDEKYAGMIARKFAGIVAKEVVGDQIAERTHDPLLGFIAKVIMYVSDQADLRSWNFLPKDLQVARLVVEPGVYDVSLKLKLGESLPTRTVQVEAGKKVFVNFRYIP